MRKTTKFMLTLAMLFGVVGGVKAKTLYVNLSALPAVSENTTWSWDNEKSEGTFAWSGASYNSTQLYGAGDYSSYTTLNLNTAAGTADHFRIIIKYNGGESQVIITPVNIGSQSITLSSYASQAILSNVSSIRLSGAGDVASGDITVSSIYLEGPDIDYIEATNVLVTDAAPGGTIDLKDLKGSEASWSVTYPSTLGNATVLCGNGDGSNESTHVNIYGYDWLCFSVTETESTGQALRVWIWDGEAGGEGSVKTLYGKPINIYNTANYEESTNATTTGTYVVNIQGYKYLKGIKTYYGGGSVKVSRAYVCKGAVPVSATGKYTLNGTTPGSASLTAALADLSATYYDATGITGTDVDLTSVANPNALFKANSGVLANDNNVIVSDACAQLALTDGYPFKAPVAFTATAAPTYDRAFAASTTTTVCLPFALTAAEAATLGTFYELSSVDGTTLHFTSVAAPVANKAYLVVPTATGLTLSETGKSIAATPADLGTTVSGVDFIGTLAATTIPASDGSYSYYAYNNGSLVKITTNAATLPAFRGYFKVAGASARSLNISLDNEATGISTLLMNNGKVNNEVYNLKGQRVSQPTKGLYIVNGKKVIK